MEKLTMKTKNLTEENIAKLVKLFPELVIEVERDGKTIKTINVDKLKNIVGDYADDSDEVYELTWAGKNKSRQKIVLPINKTLRPVPEESVDFENTENLYIEGDNFEVLKLLQESFLNKIKMIYIDPPYNTGKDFVYKDKFSMSKKDYDEETGAIDEEGNKLFKNTTTNGRFHSDWLSMMFERLIIAKDLLQDKGVIVIHIDEHEVANTEKIVSEIFGEDNMLGTIIWDKRNPKGDAKGIAYQHESIIIYAKNKDAFNQDNALKKPKDNAKNMLNKVKSLISNKGKVNQKVIQEYQGWLKKQDFSAGEKAYSYIDENGDIYRPVSMAWPNKKKAPDEYFKPLIHPSTKKECPVPERGWRNPIKTMEELQKRDLIIFGKNETIIPNRKYLLKENMYENIPSILYYAGSDDKLLKELGIPFDTPKVVDVCKKIISPFVNNDNEIVMDFFAGSSTVAHAIMKLNADDNINRKFILVQLPEIIDKDSEAYKAGYKNITEIGKERIRRATKKIKEDNKGKDLSNVDFGFRVFKTDSSNMKDVYYNPKEIDQRTLANLKDNIKDDRTDKDLLYQILLELAIPISAKVKEEKLNNKTIYRVNDNFLIGCFDDNIDLETIKQIAELKPLRIVFKDSSFKDDSTKVNCDEYLKNKLPNTIVKVI